MAFYASGLPSIAVATTDLWPSLANTIMVPWRGSTAAPQKTRARVRNPIQEATEPAISRASKHEVEPDHPSPHIPDFLKAQIPDIHFLHKDLMPADLPVTIQASIAGMSKRALVEASPIPRGQFARSFSTSSRSPSSVLFSLFKPLHQAPVPSSRSVGMMQRLPGSSPLVLSGNIFGKIVQSRQQYRGFGSGGISRSLLANREAAANRNPDSATAQNAFYQVLLKANMPAIVIERYQSGRFAKNEAADEAYGKALAMLHGSTNDSTSPAVPNTGLTDTQIQAVGQAVAAQTRGASFAIAKGQQGPGTKDGPIHVVVNESFGALAFRWVKFILWFGLFTYLSLIVITMVIEGLNTIKRPGARQDSEAKAESQSTRFSDVHGCDEAKEELQELVEFLRNPEKFNALGGKLPKGVLLVGPPGTGKTLLARAVAGEAGVPFFYMSGSEFDEVYVGVGAKRVRDLFAAARAKSPSIVFIDELDAIGGRRNTRDQAYAKQTLNQLLTELDGFEQNSGVIIIGATNFPKLLDKALTRPGRFDRHVVVPLPDVRGRIAILKHHSKKIKAAPDVNLEHIAALTPGLSGAELESIVNQAAIHATKGKQASVTTADFDWARDKVIMGAERKTMVITPKEKEMTAYHEAGHALLLYFATKEGLGRNLYKVTVLPRGETLGHTSWLPEMDKYSESAQDYMSQIEVSLGGKLAEEMVFGNDRVTSGCSADIEQATRVAWVMMGQLGMSEKLGPVDYLQNYKMLSSETKAMVEDEIKRTLDEAYVRARKLLLSKRKELDLLAKALVEYETLDRDEVEKVIHGEKLPNRIKVPLGPMTVPRPEPLDKGIPGLGPLGADGGDKPPPAAGGLVGA